MNSSNSIEEVERGPGTTLDSADFTFASWKQLPELKATIRTRDLLSVPTGERAIAMGMLAALSPVMACVAAAVKITSPGGPVLYKQERVGVDRRRSGVAHSGNGNTATIQPSPTNGSVVANAGDASDVDSSRSAPSVPDRRRQSNGYGKSFEIYKFRTMVPDAEKVSGPAWATANDPRITKLGRFLRLTRLDELPQLVNVVKGEMRLIGPRPERPHFVEKLSAEIPDYPLRLKVPPGITGLAQVEKEYDASVDDVRKKVKYDLLYVQNRSLKLDAKILIRTVDVVFRGKGAK